MFPKYGNVVEKEKTIMSEYIAGGNQARYIFACFMGIWCCA